MQHIKTLQWVTVYDLNGKMSVSNMEFFQIKSLVILDKICKRYNVV